MKKKIFVVLSTLILVSTIFIDAVAQFYLGPRAGATLSNISTPSITDLLVKDIHYLPGFSAGITGEYFINSDFSVVSELNYTEKGFRIREETDINLFNIDFPLGVKIDTRLKYVDLPVMAKYSFGNEYMRAFVGIGPQVGFAVSGRLRAKADFLLDLNLVDREISLSGLDYERFEFSGVAMAGVEFPIEGGHLFVDARFTQSLSDALRPPVIDLNIKNHGFGFGIGYRKAL